MVIDVGLQGWLHSLWDVVGERLEVPIFIQLLLGLVSVIEPQWQSEFPVILELDVEPVHHSQVLAVALQAYSLLALSALALIHMFGE